MSNNAGEDNDTTNSYFDRVVLEAGGAPTDVKGDIPIEPGVPKEVLTHPMMDLLVV